MANDEHGCEPENPGSFFAESKIGSNRRDDLVLPTRKLSDREDLLAEGVNLPERGRITEPNKGREWIVGWRDGTALSLFDGADRVFQFNTSGQLRRVFLAGQKLAARDGELSRLTRRSDAAGRMAFDTIALSTQRRDQVLQCLQVSLSELAQILASGNPQIETIGLPPNVFSGRLQRWLDDVNPVVIAHGPGVVG